MDVVINNRFSVLQLWRNALFKFKKVKKSIRDYNRTQERCWDTTIVCYLLACHSTLQLRRDFRNRMDKGLRRSSCVDDNNNIMAKAGLCNYYWIYQPLWTVIFTPQWMSFCWMDGWPLAVLCGTLLPYQLIIRGPNWNWVITVNIIIYDLRRRKENAIAFRNWVKLCVTVQLGIGQQEEECFAVHCMSVSSTAEAC